MFPSREDVTAHRRAVARIKKAQVERQHRAEELRTPAQLKEFIIEEARAHYRKGERNITIAFSVPVLNFIDWAATTKLISEKDVDQYVKQLIRKPLMRQTKAALRDDLSQNAIAPGIVSKFECAYGSGLTLDFEVKIAVLR